MGKAFADKDLKVTAKNIALSLYIKKCLVKRIIFIVLCSQVSIPRTLKTSVSQYNNCNYCRN